MKLIASLVSFRESTVMIIKYFVCDPLYLIALFVLTTYTLSEEDKTQNPEEEKYISLKTEDPLKPRSHSSNSNSDDNQKLPHRSIIE